MIFCFRLGGDGDWEFGDEEDVGDEEIGGFGGNCLWIDIVLCLSWV